MGRKNYKVKIAVYFFDRHTMSFTSIQTKYTVSLTYRKHCSEKYLHLYIIQKNQFLTENLLISLIYDNPVQKS